MSGCDRVEHVIFATLISDVTRPGVFLSLPGTAKLLFSRFLDLYIDCKKAQSTVDWDDIIDDVERTKTVISLTAFE